MNKIYLYTLLSLWGFQLSAQSVHVPFQLFFADIHISLDKSARKQIQKKANSLTQSHKHFNLYVERCALYFPHIESILKKENLPEDFKYLALQESGLVSDVISSSSAVGFWQFKEETGKEVGLKINDRVDERKNIIAATQAASVYLKKNNTFLKNWLYTLLSYNYGLTGANRMMDDKLKGAKKITLKKDTPLYIIHFLAHKIVFEKIFLSDTKLDTYLIAYPYGNGETIEQIALKTGANSEEIQRYNKWLKATLVPSDKIYWVMLPLPQRKVQNLAMQFEEITIPYTQIRLLVETQKPSLSTLDQTKFPLIIKKEIRYAEGEKIQLALVNNIPAFIAEKDQNLYAVAEALKIKPKKLLKINDMKISDKLEEGKPYYLKLKKNKADIIFHTTQPRETLWQIAQKYAIKLNKLLKKNRMKENENLETGRVLFLQKKRKKNTPIEIKNIDSLQKKNIKGEINIPKNEPKVKEGYHRVTADENLFSISKKYDISIFELKAWNNLDNQLNLEIGQILIVSPALAPREIPEEYKSKENFITIEFTDTTISQYTSNQELEETENLQNTETPNKESTEESTKKKEKTISNDERKSYITHIVKEGETLWNISNKYNVKLAQLHSWNQWLKDDFIYSGQKIKILQSSKLKKPKTHLIKKGESLYAIARKYKLSLSDLMLWNGLNEQSVLYANQRLQLASPSGNVEKKHIQTSSNKKITKIYHTISRGETLSSIALNYHVSVSELQKWNQLKGDYIQVGQQLLVSKPKANTNHPAYHIVKKGETLSAISRKYNISIPLLKRLNNKANDQISIGEKLKIRK